MSAQIDETKLTEEIKTISGQVLKTLFEQRKVDELVKHYTEDCKFIFLPENQTISGRQGITDISHREIASGAVTHNFTTTEVGAMGSMDMAYERGNFEFLNGDNEVLKHGRYVTVWKRIDGSMHVCLGVAQPNE